MSPHDARTRMAKAMIKNETTNMKVPIALIVGLTPKRIEQ